MFLSVYHSLKLLAVKKKSVTISTRVLGQVVQGMRDQQ